jgi:NAD(P)-dependent dehydrogenase (short-subunit alcohol dehydrogenase family)
MEGSVLVTGAAGAIGSATAEAFLAAGWAVLGIDRAEGVVDAVDHPAYRGVVADAGDEAAVAAAVAAAVTDLRAPLRHVVGVAGGALPAEPRTAETPLDLEVAEFGASLTANLTSQFAMARATAAALRGATGDRSLTFTSSFNALSAQGMPAYSAAKAGLIGLMHGLVRPLGREGIRVNVVAPGTVRTPRTERIWSHVDGHFAGLEAGTALGHLATPDDVARSHHALACVLTHVTGQVLVVDGGQTVVHR